MYISLKSCCTMRFITYWGLVSVFIKSLAPGRSWCGFKNAIFNLDLLIGIFKSSYINVLKWMPHDPIDDKTTLVQVMAWCRQASSHYLKQCWPTPYDVTRIRAPMSSGVQMPFGMHAIEISSSFICENYLLILHNQCTIRIVCRRIMFLLWYSWPFARII